MDATVAAIQQYYPQVFHACHVRHERRRSNAFRLSERDSSILAHVGAEWTVTARERATAVAGLRLLVRGARSLATQECPP